MAIELETVLSSANVTANESGNQVTKALRNFLGKIPSKTLNLSGTANANGQGYVDFFTSPPEKVTAMADGPLLSYHGYGGATPGDSQRSSFLIRTPSYLDGTKAEIPMFVNYTVNTGRLDVWKPNTAYAVGKVINSETTGNLYKAIQAGTSSSTGVGPGGLGNVVDGSVIWQWIAYGQVDAKIAAVFETEMKENAGRTWSFVNNLILRPGAPRTFAVGAELDLGNFSGNCPIDGTTFVTPLFIFGHTEYTSTAAQVISTGAASNVKAYHFGTWYQYAAGGNLTQDCTIVDDTCAAVGLGFGQTAGRLSKHSTATIRDLSDSNVGLFMAGHYANSALNTEFAEIEGYGGLATAIRMKAEQGLCFNGGNNGLVYNAFTKKLFYVVNNIPVWSVDEQGNFRTRGTFTANVEP